MFKKLIRYEVGDKIFTNSRDNEHVLPCVVESVKEERFNRVSYVVSYQGATEKYYAIRKNSSSFYKRT